MSVVRRSELPVASPLWKRSSTLGVALWESQGPGVTEKLVIVPTTRVLVQKFCLWAEGGEPGQEADSFLKELISPAAE